MADGDNTQLQVELVAADRTVWSGQARTVIAKTAEGDIGVLRDHTPVLSLLVPGVVEIDPEDGDRLQVAVDGGFISVANNRVSILAEHAALAADIDVEAARRRLEEAQGQEGAEAEREARAAEAQIRAAERA